MAEGTMDGCGWRLRWPLLDEDVCGGTLNDVRYERLFLNVKR